MYTGLLEPKLLPIAGVPPGEKSVRREICLSLKVEPYNDLNPRGALLYQRFHFTVLFLLSEF